MSATSSTHLPVNLPVCTSELSDDKGVSPAYLYRKRNIYYFRYALPKTLKQHWGCSEVRISLRTAYLRVAKFRARMMYAEIAKTVLDVTMLEYKEIRRRMNILLQRLLDADHKDISKREGISYPDGDITYARMCELQAQVYACWNNDEDRLIELGSEVIEPLLLNRIFHPDEIIGENDSQTRENMLQILKACNETLVTLQQILAARARGDFLMEEQIMGQDFGKLPHQENDSAPEPPIAPSGASLLYSEAMERYISEKLSVGAWKKHSLSDHRERLKGFLEIIGDKPIQNITRDDLRNLRDTLINLPPNRARAKAFKGKSIQGILELDVGKTLSVKTVNIHVEAVASMFDWCIREGLLKDNQAKGLLLKDDRQPIELRDAFTNEELSKIFAHPKFSKREFKSVEYFWIPLVGLYTGMRLEGIAQLHCTDIKESSPKGIWFFDINDRGVDENNWGKLLKTKNARRLVPIHKILIDAGFLEYHKKIVKDGHIRLFPDLNKSEKTAKLGKQPGKQFKAVVTATLGDASGKSFHSLRHTFADFYKQKGLLNDYFRQVFGHEQPTLAAKQYGGKFPPELLYTEIISQLDYGIDISTLIKENIKQKQN